MIAPCGSGGGAPLSSMKALKGSRQTWDGQEQQASLHATDAPVETDACPPAAALGYTWTAQAELSSS